MLDSEYLITLVVAVPKSLMKDWVDQYETLTQMVVPRSSQYQKLIRKIAEDDEYGLFNVTLFQKVVDEFIGKAREKKYDNLTRFLVRDFKWDPATLSDEKKTFQDLINTEKEQFVIFVN